MLNKKQTSKTKRTVSPADYEMSNVDVPNIGVIYGLGYSGGAIPLASSYDPVTEDAVFGTIQPGALANMSDD